MLCRRRSPRVSRNTGAQSQSAISRARAANQVSGDGVMRACSAAESMPRRPLRRKAYPHIYFDEGRPSSISNWAPPLPSPVSPLPSPLPPPLPPPYFSPMPPAPRDTTPRPRPSRAKSGKPPAPPAEGAAGTPVTKRSAEAGFAEAPQAPFLPAASSTLPALRNSGPPSRNFADMTASLNALLARPHERSERARQVLALQPMLASHPLVAGEARLFTPHRPPRPDKSEGGIPFKLVAEFEPKGDQPTAIRELVEGVNAHERNQVLLGVTGSGKTFTMAKVIEATQRPALILAPNKTLAAQLYGEFKGFFPDNAVEYFVSY